MRTILASIGFLSVLSLPMLRKYAVVTFVVYLAGKVSSQLLSLRYAGFKYPGGKSADKEAQLAWFHIAWCLAGHMGTLLGQYIARIA